MLRFISVDLQYDFTRPKGKHFKQSRTSIGFVRKTLIPFLKKGNHKIAEIISDYRQFRPGDSDDSCRPGEWGYTSEIPDELVESRWIKCMNSPFFSRENIGNADKKPGYPRERPTDFYRWLEEHATSPQISTIVLFGLTLDCCVLCTAQAIRFRGYNVKILMDATDTYSGGERNKKQVMDLVVNNWAEPVTWKQLKEMIASEGILK